MGKSKASWWSSLGTSCDQGKDHFGCQACLSHFGLIVFINMDSEEVEKMRTAYSSLQNLEPQPGGGQSVRWSRSCLRHKQALGPICIEKFPEHRRKFCIFPLQDILPFSSTSTGYRKIFHIVSRTSILFATTNNDSLNQNKNG